MREIIMGSAGGIGGAGISKSVADYVNWGYETFHGTPFPDYIREDNATTALFLIGLLGSYLAVKFVPKDPTSVDSKVNSAFAAGVGSEKKRQNDEDGVTA